jgi:hypothetical protein
MLCSIEGKRRGKQHVKGSATLCCMGCAWPLLNCRNESTCEQTAHERPAAPQLAELRCPTLLAHGNGLCKTAPKFKFPIQLQPSGRRT